VIREWDVFVVDVKLDIHVICCFDVIYLFNVFSFKTIDIKETLKAGKEVQNNGNG
jgi:hypothetical protein